MVDSNTVVNKEVNELDKKYQQLIERLQQSQRMIIWYRASTAKNQLYAIKFFKFLRDQKYHFFQK